jgi:hypothetical protein
MKKATLILAGSFFLLLACKKSSDGDKKPAPGFFPSKSGNTWSYEFKNNLTSTNTNFTLTASASDTTISGTAFRVFVRSTGVHEYYAQTGSLYEQFAFFDALAQSFRLPYLRDDLPKGGTWQQDVPAVLPGIPTPVNVRFVNTISDKNVSHTVLGKTYQEVIMVSTTIPPITIPGLPLPISPVADIKNYFAKGVGRIYGKTKITISIPTMAPVSVDEETLLKSHSVTQ